MKPKTKATRLNISDELWSKIEPLLPVPVNTHPRGGGKKRTTYRSVMNGILFVLKTGCKWKALDATGICSGSTANARFKEWERAGVFLKFWENGLLGYDELQGIDWKWQVMDGAMTPVPITVFKESDKTREGEEINQHKDQTHAETKGIVANFHKSEAPDDFFCSRIESEIVHELKKFLNGQGLSEYVDINASFIDLGIDSSMGLELVEALNQKLELCLGIEALFDYGSPKKLAEYIACDYAVQCQGKLEHIDKNTTGTFETNGREKKKVCRDEKVSTVLLHNESKETKQADFKKCSRISAYVSRQFDIAIIGVSGRFPASETVNEFWDNLETGKCCVKEIDRPGWDVAAFYNPDPARANKSISKWGGLLKNIDAFDPLFFNISPREAEEMDPQQRLFLEESFKAFEDAGYSGETLSEKRVGVFVGARSSDYIKNARLSRDINAQMFMGHEASVLAARISYYLNLKGPCMSVDTACSASLVALHLACESIRSSESDMALAGGIFVMGSPEFMIMASKAGLLSPDAGCRSFDNAANGTVVGEGVGVVLLKRLPDAVRDGDHIYGVIKSSAVNHDGKTNGISAPSALSQQELLCEAYAKAGINPETVTFIEAHGTGTKLGDPLEVKALTGAFERYTEKKQFCALGSLKPNMGHAMLAAGVAGVLKVLMCMKHKKIPPTIHFMEPNEHIDFKNTPFYVNTELQEWQPNGQGARRAGVSAFGLSGTNCHVVVEEAPAGERETVTIDASCQLVMLSAKTEEALCTKAEDLLGWLNREGNGRRLYDIAYTLCIGRSHFEIRCACVISSVEELKEKLELVRKAEKSGDILTGRVDQGNKSSRYALKEFGNQLLTQLVSGDAVSADMRKEKLLAAADLYVQGYDLQWDRLYETARPQRISLPTYPFAQKRYWIGKSEGRIFGKNASARLHPLLDDVDLSLAFDSRSIVFRKVFKSSDPVVRDHKAGGKTVLPAAVCLEMACAAVSQIKGGADIFLKHVVWLEPCVLEAEGSQIEIVVRDEEGRVFFELQGMRDAEVVRYAQGECTRGGPAEHAAAGLIDIALIQKRCQKVMGFGVGKQDEGRDSCCNSVRELWVNKEELLGVLELPTECQGEMSAYRLHPLLMTGALEVGGWAEARRGNAKKPVVIFSMEGLEIVRQLGARGYAYVTESGCDGYTIVLADEEGRICVRMRNAVYREMRDRLRQFFYRPHWEARALPETGRVISGMEGRSVCIVYADGSRFLGDALANYHREDEVCRVRLGSTERPDGERAWELVAGDAAGFRRWFGETGRIDRIYFLGGIGTGDVSAESFERSQQEGVWSLLWLMKSLEEKGRAGEGLELKIVTSDVHEVLTGGEIRPAGGSLLGLSRTIIREYPQVRLSCIDMSGKDMEADTNKAAECVMREPEQRSSEVVAYRGWRRYVRVLEPVNLEPASRSVFRSGGVYFILGGAGKLGFEVSRYLSERYGARLVWVGRSGLDESKEKKIWGVEAAGGKVLYVQADVTDFESMKRAEAEAVKVYGKIHGVIHSGLVFQGKLLGEMDEETFRSVLDVKVKGSVVLHRVFAGADLDFMLFFSSMQSFVGDKRQGNYAAGCTFQDAYAGYIRAMERYKVEVINWGYWHWFDDTEEGRQQLNVLGYEIIDADEGLEALERVLGCGTGQVLAGKAHSDMLEEMGVKLDRLVGIYPEEVPSAGLAVQRQAVFKMDRGDNEAYGLFERYCRFLLLEALQRMGAFRETGERYGKAGLCARLGIAKQHMRLYDELLGILEKGRFIELQGQQIVSSGEVCSEATREELKGIEETEKKFLERYPVLAAQVRLACACLKRYPEILRGEVPATEVIFPNSSMELVEGIYRGNALADYCSGIVRDTLRSYVEAQIGLLGKGDKVRVLEVGAGTGSTSAWVLEGLAGYGEKVEYVYTDISKAFTLHGRRQYGGLYGFAAFKELDIDKDIESQGYERGAYDAVIAANVVHATRDIRKTVGNIKKLLKRNGLLVLNEVTKVSELGTLTFGLLEGWWLYADESERLPGGPLLDTGMWERLLREEGFGNVWVAGEGTEQRQNVIIGESNGEFFLNRRRKQEMAINTGQQESKKKIQASLGGSKKKERAKARIYNEETLLQYIQEKTITVFLETLALEREDIDLQKQFSDYGVDSILGVNLIECINKEFGTRLRITALFDYVTLSSLCRYIYDVCGSAILKTIDLGTAGGLAQDSAAKLNHSLAVHEEKQNTAFDQFGDLQFAESSRAEYYTADNDRTQNRKDVAVIGISGKFPGAKDVMEFWDNLSNGRCSITEVPPQRWDVAAYYDPDMNAPNKTCCKWGGFIDDVDKFDPLFFNIAPAEAESMDPRQKLLLEAVWSAVEDAGYTIHDLHRIRTGLFVGAENFDYGQLQMHQGDSADADMLSLTSVLNSMLANRISFLLNFQGPSEVIDTACSGSTVAMHRAILSLQQEECDVAVVGGANILLTPMPFVALSKAHLLSSDGKIRLFDKDGTGFVEAEAVCSLLLKPLWKAEQDRDHIYAVLRGSAVGHGGRGSSLTAPKPEGQADIIVTALRRAGVDPGTINYIDLQGTGKLLGDTIELDAYKMAFSRLCDYYSMDCLSGGYCGVGSVKPFVGHSNSVSGIVALFKTIMSLQHSTLPATINIKETNQDIDIQNSPFYLVQKTTAWKPLLDNYGKVVPRRAVINSYGLGGVNACLVVEEYIPAAASSESEGNECSLHNIVVLSAKNEERLKEYAAELKRFLVGSGELSLQDIAYTLLVGREAMDERLAMIVESRDDFIEKLGCFLEGRTGLENVFMSRTEGITKKRELQSLFDNDKELQPLIVKWSTTGKLARIAELWVAGVDMDLSVLPQNEGCRRISLPTYPFKKQRCWFAESGNGHDHKDAGNGRDGDGDAIPVQQDLELGFEDKVLRDIHRIVSKLLRVSEGKLSADEDLRKYGFNSLLGARLANRVQSIYGAKILVSRVLEQITVKGLACYLVAEKIATADSYGTPKNISAAVGTSNQAAATLTINQQEQKPVFDEKWIKLILKGVAKGRITPEQAMLFEDQMLANKRKGGYAISY